MNDWISDAGDALEDALDWLGWSDDTSEEEAVEAEEPADEPDAEEPAGNTTDDLPGDAAAEIPSGEDSEEVDVWDDFEINVEDDALSEGDADLSGFDDLDFETPEDDALSAG